MIKRMYRELDQKFPVGVFPFKIDKWPSLNLKEMNAQGMNDESFQPVKKCSLERKNGEP